MTCHVRPAVADDAAALSALALRSKAHWGYDDVFLAACADALRVRAEDLVAGPAFVAEDDSRLAVGFVLVDLHGADGAEVTHLFVDPPAMGTGVGRSLWELAVDAALVAGAASVVVESDPNAEGFYLHLGTQRIGERPSSVWPDRRLPLLRLTLD